MWDVRCVNQLLTYASRDARLSANGRQESLSLETARRIVTARGGSPMALRKCSMRTAVFLTSLLYTSLPTMGQNGTLLPSSCATPSASAVLPVPGAPAADTLDGGFSCTLFWQWHVTQNSSSSAFSCSAAQMSSRNRLQQPRSVVTQCEARCRVRVGSCSPKGPAHILWPSLGGWQCITHRACCSGVDAMPCSGGQYQQSNALPAGALLTSDAELGVGIPGQFAQVEHLS